MIGLKNGVNGRKTEEIEGKYYTKKDCDLLWRSNSPFSMVYYNHTFIISQYRSVLSIKNNLMFGVDFVARITRKSN